MEIVNEIRDLLLKNGAGEIGFTNLDLIDSPIKKQFNLGISILVALDPKVVAGIKEGPTIEYYNEYNSVNNKLNFLSGIVSEFLNSRKIENDHWAATGERVKEHNISELPHKTVATLSGMGWIGKCALLVTKKFGSAIRLTTVLAKTDIIIPDNSISKSFCGECNICVNLCPAKAPKGIHWKRGLFRDEFLNVELCEKTALNLAMERTGKELTFCGICISNCPFTIKYLNNTIRV